MDQQRIPHRTFENSRMIVVVSEQFEGLAHSLALIHESTGSHMSPVTVYTSTLLAEPLLPWYAHIPKSSIMRATLDRFYVVFIDEQERIFAILRRDLFSVLNEGKVGVFGTTRKGFERLKAAHRKSKSVTTIDPRVNPNAIELGFSYTVIPIGRRVGPELERNLMRVLRVPDPVWLAKELRALDARFAPESIAPPPRLSEIRIRASCSTDLQDTHHCSGIRSK